MYKKTTAFLTTLLLFTGAVPMSIPTKAETSSKLDASHFKGRLGDFFEIQQLRIRSMHNSRQSRQSEKASETETTIPDAPYVGMHESMISRTSLGQPNDNVRHNTEMVNGQVQYANLYDFTEDGRCIFTARCLNNKVIQIWDYRDQPRPKPRGEVFSSRDDFRIEDFTDPEDFYDWYYDDFVDYEEAEDYYYEHGGK